MRKLLLIVLILLVPTIAMSATYYSWRYAQSADCQAEATGKVHDLCYDTAKNGLYKCVPTAGDCDTAGEWEEVLTEDADYDWTGVHTFATTVSLGNIVTIDQNLGHDGDTDTSLGFGANTVTLNAGCSTYVTLAGTTNGDISLNPNTINIDTLISTDTTWGAFTMDAGADTATFKIPVIMEDTLAVTGTTTLSTTLTVDATDSVANISAISGALSISSTVLIDAGDSFGSAITFEGTTSSDGCDTWGEGACFYNTTDNTFCFCNGTTGVLMYDTTVSCF